MKYVRIIENVAQEVITTDPATIFHPDVASMFTEYEDSVDVRLDYILEDGTWSAPPEPEVEPEVGTEPV